MSYRREFRETGACLTPDKIDAKGILLGKHRAGGRWWKCLLPDPLML